MKIDRVKEFSPLDKKSDQRTNPPWRRRRSVSAVLILLVAACGIGSRRNIPGLPTLIKLYAGDTLWALEAFLVIGFIVPGLATRWSALAALAISFAVEFSQMWHPPWLDAIRATSLGSLILGHGFVPSDLVCYTVGVAIGSLFEILTKLRRFESTTKVQQGT